MVHFIQVSAHLFLKEFVMDDSTTTIDTLKKSMRSFVDERDWKQFHTPKNISMALAVEAAELMEHFMWVDSSKDEKQLEINRDMVEQEVADIAAYLLSLCTYYDIDLTQAFERKKKLNEKKYSLEKSKAFTKKFTSL